MKRNYLLVILAATLVVVSLQACSNRPQRSAPGLTATPAPPGKSYADYINDSLTFYSAGDYQRSLEAAQSALQLQPNSALAHNNVCAAYNALKQWDKAIEACQKAVAIQPDFELAKNNLRAAQQAQTSGLPAPQVTPQQTAAVPAAADPWTAAINESLAYYQAGDYPKSIAAAQSALQLQPNSAVAYITICAGYNQMKQWDQAIEACQKALAIDPNSTLAKSNLAMAQAAGLSPAGGPTPTKSYEDYINDGLAFYNAGDYQKSVEAAQSALQLQPDSALAYNNICAAYNALQQWDQAIQACQQALVIQPDYERAKNNLRAAQQPAAVPAAGDPWTAAINESLATYQAGDYPKSIEAAQKALAVKPDSALAYNNICAAYNALQQWDQAIAACLRALDIDPSFELAKSNLGVAVIAKQKQ